MSDAGVGQALRLQCLRDEFSLHRLPPDAEIPPAVLDSKIYWIGKTDEELSIVCASGIVVPSDQHSELWSCFRVCGPLDLGMTGVLAGIAAVLRDAGISIFALSTFDTDYVLVKSKVFEAAQNALSAAGYDL